MSNDLITYPVSFYERTEIGRTLPNQGNLLEVSICTSIRDKIKWDTEEILKFTTEGTSYLPEAYSETKDIQFTKEEASLIERSLKSLESKKGLPTTRYALALYKKFVSA